MKLDRAAYLRMQIADYILNNSDRHEQNWGFLMDNATGRIKAFCPLFDHDRAFCGDERIISQTAELPETQKDAAVKAQAELQLKLPEPEQMKKPEELNLQQWEQVKEHIRELIVT